MIKIRTKKQTVKNKVLVGSSQHRDESVNKRQKIISGLLLFGLSTFMAIFIIIGFINNPAHFTNFMGINKTALEIPTAWVVAILVSICYIAYTARMIPAVRQNLFNFSCWFKLLGVYAAFSSGIIEELVFRKMLMDWLDINGLNVILQIVISAITFGLLHFSWSLFGGNIKTGIGSAISTIVLGLFLAFIYVVAERNVLPSIIAHMLINLFVEPWLILNAVSSTSKSTDSLMGSNKNSD